MAPGKIYVAHNLLHYADSLSALLKIHCLDQLHLTAA